MSSPDGSQTKVHVGPTWSGFGGRLGLCALDGGASEEPYRALRHRLRCRCRREETSVTTGTIFERSQKPLTLWFAAAWYTTNQKNGASALGLQRVLGLGSYQTAWTMLHRFRSVMVRPDREWLRGRVEVDEAYVGGEETGVTGRQTLTKEIVAIAVELDDPRGLGLVRLRHVPDVSGESLLPFVSDVVEPGTAILTEGWAGYKGLSKRGYAHQVTVLSSSDQPVPRGHARRPPCHLSDQALGPGYIRAL